MRLVTIKRHKVMNKKRLEGDFALEEFSWSLSEEE